MNSISMDWDAIDSTKAMVIDRPKAKKGLNERRHRGHRRKEQGQDYSLVALPHAL